MYEIGRKQILTVEKKADFGVFLRDPEESYTVLLPASQVPEECAVGDRLEVFLYKDSEDRPIATRKEPKLTLHEVGWLTAVQITGIGAFLDWGLDKDLLLPFHEQPKKRIQKGQECLVAVYIDKSGRLCATMNVYPYLQTDSPYRTGDQVEGTVYETSSNFGTFVAVDDRYSGLIPKKELVRDLEIGSRVRARVLSVRPDGKLNLSIREKAYLQIGEDAEFLLAEIDKRDGLLPFTDKSDPERIRAELHMSKNEFKRAVGHLLKDGLIRFTPEGIVRQ
ncbi:MAG: S1 RNA-binding domain-containing protein [Lachnospiraceae bacterium]|nr:S1 RNA-binding domain-containing protein [Lachnospiraceae bacterium]